MVDVNSVVSTLRAVRGAVIATLSSVSRARLVGSLAAIVILVAVALLVPMPTAVQLRDWATSAGPWFPLAFLAAHIVVTVFPFPRTAFTLAAGENDTLPDIIVKIRVSNVAPGSYNLTCVIEPL